MGIFPTALRNKKYVSSHKKYLTLLPQCIACYLTCKHALPTLGANNQCKHSIQTFNETFNSNIHCKHSIRIFHANMQLGNIQCKYHSIYVHSVSCGQHPGTSEIRKARETKLRFLCFWSALYVWH